MQLNSIQWRLKKQSIKSYAENLFCIVKLTKNKDEYLLFFTSIQRDYKSNMAVNNTLMFHLF